MTSTQRVSCSGATELSAKAENLTPGVYEVSFHPGRGHRVLKGKTTVEGTK